MRRFWLIAVALLVTNVARAEDLALPVPAEDLARVEGAAAIGKLIYDYDQAAWVTTDAMLAQIPRDQLPPGGGWVVEPRADGALVVSYFGATDGRASVFFVAATKDGKLIEQRAIPKEQRPGLSPVEQRMVAAQKVAQTRLGGPKGRNPCEPRPFNSVTLAPRTIDDPVTVYYLTAQRERDVYPAGGHYRFDVDKTGRILVDRAFTNSCITLSGAGKGQSGQPVAAAITHLLDPTPTEIHVWLSLWMRMPVYVGTADRRLWEVNGDRIRLVALDVGNRSARP